MYKYMYFSGHWGRERGGGGGGELGLKLELFSQATNGRCTQ